jgi:predicted  nucleic acid-binding Zn-ribbon protein
MNEVAHTHQGMMIEAKKDGREKGVVDMETKYRQEMNSMEDDISDLERDNQGLVEEVKRVNDKYQTLRDQYKDETSKLKLEVKRLTDLIDGVEKPKSKEVKWSI